jgi:hypothetical protein
VNLVFGKIEDDVVVAKVWRHCEELFLGLVVLLRDCCDELMNNKVGQQPCGHTLVTSCFLLIDECIFVFCCFVLFRLKDNSVFIYQFDCFSVVGFIDTFCLRNLHSEYYNISLLLLVNLFTNDLKNNIFFESIGQKNKIF